MIQRFSFAHMDPLDAVCRVLLNTTFWETPTFGIYKPTPDMSILVIRIDDFLVFVPSVKVKGIDQYVDVGQRFQVERASVEWILEMEDLHKKSWMVPPTGFRVTLPEVANPDGWPEEVMAKWPPRALRLAPRGRTLQLEVP